MKQYSGADTSCLTLFNAYTISVGCIIAIHFNIVIGERHYNAISTRHCTSPQAMNVLRVCPRYSWHRVLSNDAPRQTIRHECYIILSSPVQKWLSLLLHCILEHGHGANNVTHEVSQEAVYDLLSFLSCDIQIQIFITIVFINLLMKTIWNWRSHIYIIDLYYYSYDTVISVCITANLWYMYRVFTGNCWKVTCYISGSITHTFL